MLNSVVLPAPFGPTTLVMWCPAAVKLTACSAWTPPNETPTFMTSSIGGLLAAGESKPQSAEQPHQPLGGEHHQKQQDQTENHQTKIRPDAQCFGQDREDNGGDDRD